MTKVTTKTARIARPSQVAAEAAKLAGTATSSADKVFLKLLFTPDEKKALKRAALDHGTSLAAFVLYKCLGDGS